MGGYFMKRICIICMLIAAALTLCSCGTETVDLMENSSGDEGDVIYMTPADGREDTSEERLAVNT